MNRWSIICIYFWIKLSHLPSLHCTNLPPNINLSFQSDSLCMTDDQRPGSLLHNLLWPELQYIYCNTWIFVLKHNYELVRVMCLPSLSINVCVIAECQYSLCIRRVKQSLGYGFYLTWSNTQHTHCHSKLTQDTWV